MRYRARALVICALAVGLAAAGCSKNTGSTGPGDQATNDAPIEVDIAGKAPTPAPEVPGAKSGGTITWLEQAAPEHLDPQQIYVTDELTIETLLYRHLTNYIEAADGKLKVVGDLATNAGESSDGGKTWTYHLRDKIKFEDGTPITSKDIAYGIARSFGPYGQQGPSYLAAALDPDGKFKPEQGDVPPGVTLPDDKTIVFKFADPQPALPYIAALPTTTPVPKAKDTGAKYESEFVAMGPYMRDGAYDQTTKLTLKKNPNWDPTSDPIRHAYADKFVFDFSSNRDDQTQRLIADQGADQSAVATALVAQANIQQVSNDPALLARVGKAPTLAMYYIAINNQRVTDLKVRQAANWAFDRAAWITAVGGPNVAGPAHGLMPPSTPGYLDFNAYPSADEHGDVAKATALLAGQKPKLTYCFANTPTQQKYAVVFHDSLAKAGFDIALNPIEASVYYTSIGDKTTTCDFSFAGWGPDFPDGESVLDQILNGASITPKGNQNYSYFNVPAIDQKMKDLKNQTDRVAAAPKYGELDKEILADYAPYIPTYNLRFFNLHGSKVHAFVSPMFSEFNLVNAWVG